MRWKYKAAIQSSLSKLPYGRRIYFLGQRLGGRLKHFRIESRLQYAEYFLKNISEIGESIKGKKVVEIGTGWAPILPLVFWIVGAESINTYDVARWLRPNLIKKSIKQLEIIYRPYKNNQANLKDFHDEIQINRLKILEDITSTKLKPSEILKSCNILYQAPVDTGNLALGDSSVDIVFSNLVLELIPVNELKRLFTESYRILRPNGIMMHLIDTKDQFASGDSSINSINFLQYSEKEFSRYNSEICFQNRLRTSSYYKLITDCNFSILKFISQVDERSLREYPNMRINNDFRGISPEELCTKSVFILARKP
jgi:SAM-dependent methyltransferase